VAAPKETEDAVRRWLHEAIDTTTTDAVLEIKSFGDALRVRSEPSPSLSLCACVCVCVRAWCVLRVSCGVRVGHAHMWAR
jgi:hypothetical protein